MREGAFEDKQKLGGEFFGEDFCIVELGGEYIFLDEEFSDEIKVALIDDLNILLGCDCLQDVKDSIKDHIFLLPVLKVLKNLEDLNEVLLARNRILEICVHALLQRVTNIHAPN